VTVIPQPPDILSPEFAADPYPVHYHQGTGSWLISRYEDVERIFRGPVFTTDNYDWQLEPVHGGRTIVQMSGHEHAVRRALVAPAFRGRELRERFLPVIERNARELIDGFRGASQADLVDRFATRFPVNVIVDMLGLDRADHDRFHDWYAAVVGYFANLAQDPEVAEAGLRAGREPAAYLLPVIGERRAAPGEDLLSSLCTAEIDGTTMTDQDITSFVSLLLSAGGETTDKAISGMFRNLLAHPDQLAAVRADRALAPAAFAESLRHSPPLQMIMRQPAEDVTLSGGTVPAGSTVTCLIGAANRDERHYAPPIGSTSSGPTSPPTTPSAPPPTTSPSPSGGTSAWARCWPRPRWRSAPTNCSTPSPTWTSRTASRPPRRVSSSAARRVSRPPSPRPPRAPPEPPAAEGPPTAAPARPGSGRTCCPERRGRAAVTRRPEPPAPSGRPGPPGTPPRRNARRLSPYALSPYARPGTCVPGRGRTRPPRFFTGSHSSK
jgi:cytochrome P450